MNLLENIVTEMTPQEFEIYCLKLLNDLQKDLSGYRIEHNKIYSTNDGHYQLDGIIEFEVFGVKYKTIVECKKYKEKIKRSQIQVLHDTIRNTGAQKGIFISTSSFQKGAMEYAKIHGIALMQIVDGILLNIQNSISPARHIIFNFPRPEYVFALYNLDYFCPSEFIYEGKIKAIAEYLLK